MKILICCFCSLLLSLSGMSQGSPSFKVVGFFSGKQEEAHTTFVNQANRFFAAMAKQHNFVYDSTADWNNLNDSFLSSYQVVIFLEMRSNTQSGREAFERFIKKGGAWMGFHFAGFALTPSDYPMDWDWYHNTFLGAGSYVSNTWRPTPAWLKVEAPTHPAVKGLPAVFQSAPSEWYRWQNDLTKNPDIQILLSVDPRSFPLGTGPKLHEIWHSGYYPIVWTNKKFKMVYFNMGHNDLMANHQVSDSFSKAEQNQLIQQSLLWLGGR